MNNSLQIVQAFSQVGASVASIVTAVNSRKALRRKQLIILEEELLNLSHVIRSNNIGQLVRMSILEMHKTSSYIKELHLSQDMLPYSTNLLQIQFKMLCRNLDSYDQTSFYTDSISRYLP